MLRFALTRSGVGLCFQLRVRWFKGSSLLRVLQRILCRDLLQRRFALNDPQKTFVTEDQLNEMPSPNKLNTMLMLRP
jgi:hypothetical protein